MMKTLQNIGSICRVLGLQQYLGDYIQATNVTEPEPSFLRGAGAVLFEGSAEFEVCSGLL